jgi:hypothetical protein
MQGEDAVSEIIGAVLLIGIIVGAFGIFSALYLPGLKPEPIPQVKISMACDDTAGSSDIEYPCTRGSFHCYPLDNETCENDCLYRDYSVNPDISSEQYTKEYMRCMENCMNPICSDLEQCEVLYLCHNGGESLIISDMRIIVNGNDIGHTSWGYKQQLVSEVYVTPPPDGAKLQNGDSLRILDPSGSNPVDNVMVTYTLPSGAEYTLAMNQWGTDIE